MKALLLLLLCGTANALDLSGPTVLGQPISPASISATGGHSHIEDSNASLHIHDGTGAVLGYAASSVAVTNGVIQSIIGNAEILRVNATGLGIGTTSPGTKLHVSSGVLTVDGTGAGLNVAGSTLTVASSGIITAPSQPAVRAYLTTTRTTPSGALTPIYFDSENYDTQEMHSVVTSSDTFTVPAGGGGLYLIVFSVQWASAATGTRVINQVLIDGVVSATTEIVKTAGTLMTNTTTLVSLLTAGQAVTSKIYQDSGSVYGVVGDASPGSQVYLSMTKLW